MSSIVTNDGTTGNGKNFRSLMIVDKYKKKEPFVIDPFQQYLGYDYINQVDPHDEPWKFLPRIKNGIIIVDEAQLLLNRISHTQALETFAQCRHNFTMTILCFSSLQLMPWYVKTYANWHIIGHTNDDIKIAKEFGPLEPKVYRAMRSLQMSRPVDPNDPLMHCAMDVPNI